jgi:hypothetical protein
LSSSPFTPQLRPLSVGEVLDAGFKTLRHRFGTLLLCVLVPLLPLSTLGTIVVASTDEWAYDANAGRYARTDGAIAGLLASRLLLIVGAVFAIAACFKVISAAYLGERAGAGSSLRHGLARLFPLIVAYVVVGVVLLLLTAVSVQIYVTAPLVVLFGVRWAVTFPAIVAERVGPFRGMRRSWQLTRGGFWRSLATLAVLTVIVLVLWLAIVVSIGAAVAAVDTMSGLALAVLDTVLIVVMLMLIYPLVAAILTVLYYDLRVRREGFDLQLLAASVGARFEATPERRDVPAGQPVPAGGGGFAPPEEPAPAS